MIKTQYINLNMIPSGILPVLYMSQNDIGRPLGMAVYNGSENVDLDTYTCTIEATRTDGTAITAAVTTDDNIGAFVTTATMTNKADKYLAKLVLFDSNSRRVASLAFVMCVTPKTMDENAESIEEDASLYQQYTGTVQALIADIREDIADINTHISDMYFDTCVEMKASATLKAGMICQTAGYYAVDDGGGALYRIYSTVPSTYYETLANGLYAELIQESEVNVKQWGAKGDGTTDDTAILTACADYCRTNNLPLFIPKNCTMLIADGTTLIGVKIIRAYGTIKLAGDGMLWVQYYSSQTTFDWYFYNVTGTLRLSGLKNGFVDIVYATTLELYADSTVSAIGSIAYNIFKLGYTPTLLITGVNSGWINENQFYGGRISRFDMTGTYQHNNNKFYNPNFENSTVDFHTGHANYVYGARIEGVCYRHFYPRAYGNFFEVSWGNNPTVGATSPESSDQWIDDNGCNVGVRAFIDPYNHYEKTYTASSKNYPTDKTYPLNGKLHTASYNDYLMVTNLIDIEKMVGVQIWSDATFFRIYVSLYNDNKELITTEPANSPFFGRKMTWGSNVYNSGGTNQSSFYFGASRMNYRTGADSGVKFIKIRVRGYTGTDMEFLKMQITTPRLHVINPFTADRLTGTAAPSAGDWENGDFVWNTDSSKSVVGWVYNNGAWHQISY